ncbi:MAG: molybdopterin-guanine dinucleotide biosynthesis protein B [Gammaproteobacteria bacterium]|nr:molybdopterin-guanine dinucleotide biosynthesis protein B [Gammaproteobacteria bacterium]
MPNSHHASPPLLGFAAYSGVGKTTLLKAIIPQLRQQQLRLGVIKLSHHNFEIDLPGKDSYELRHAGATQILLTSPYRQALITEQPTPCEPQLAAMVAQLDQRQLDLILVEGFRHEPFSKIELYRPSLGKPLLYPNDPHIIAIASDAPLAEDSSLPELDLNNSQSIAAFILQWWRARKS